MGISEQLQVMAKFFPYNEPIVKGRFSLFSWFLYFSGEHDQQAKSTMTGGVLFLKNTTNQI